MLKTVKKNIVVLILFFLTVILCTSARAGWSEPVLISELNDPICYSIDPNICDPEDYPARLPYLTNDKLTIYFSRYSYYYGHGCIVKATRSTPNGLFTSKRILTELITEYDNIAGAWLSDDEQRLYYNEKVGTGGMLKMAELSGDGQTWAPTRTFDELHDDIEGGETQCSLTADELIIFYQSEYDLFTATRTEPNGTFSNIQSLDELNSDDIEFAPRISPDGLTIYFDSNRDGNCDLYKATRLSVNDTFDNIEKLSVSTDTYNEQHIYITPDKKNLYFYRNFGDLSGIYVSKWIGTTYHVDGVTGSNSNDGLSRETAFETIQYAIDKASDGDTIIVAEGTYVENIYIDKDIILSSTDPNDISIVESTIIDGNANGHVVEFSGSETENCKLNGFTITNGDEIYGGGIYGNFTKSEISHCIIENNYANYGGGLFIYNGTIKNCVITGNTAGYDGGGLFVCSGTISKCAISGNTAENYGGGLFEYDGTITNCTVTGNIAVYDGGGLRYCNGTIINCTITGNTAGYDGGGLNGCHGAITNCIIWDNLAGDSGDDLYQSSIPSYSCYPGGYGSNISTDPNFVDPDNDDYHLKSERGRYWPEYDLWIMDKVTSPCIDAGDPLDNTLDEPMPNGARINMGAYGGTGYASMSEWPLKHDINYDSRVDLADLASMASEWLNSLPWYK